MFSYEFCEIFEKTFFIEHLWATASAYLLKTSEKLNNGMKQVNRTLCFLKWNDQYESLSKWLQ